MRTSIREFVRLARDHFGSPEPVIEFGSYQPEGQSAFADLRSLFSGKKYVGCDLREGPGVDRVEDLHAITMDNESAGTILCVDTLEHVADPRKAVLEMARILSPEGILVLSSVMDFPIHLHPHDFWRFTPESFRLLAGLGCAEGVIGYQGYALQPHTVFVIAWKRASVARAAQARAFIESSSSLSDCADLKGWKISAAKRLRRTVFRQDSYLGQAIDKYAAYPEVHFERVIFSR